MYIYIHTLLVLRLIRLFLFLALFSRPHSLTHSLARFSYTIVQPRRLSHRAASPAQPATESASYVPTARPVRLLTAKPLLPAVTTLHARRLSPARYSLLFAHLLTRSLVVSKTGQDRTG
ncbi:hypothetical protein BKA80DRAFT_37087 [Phyllosticta citrichinensis]